MESKRLIREHKTVYKMITIYCHAHHRTKKYLCSECGFVAEYAESRLLRCMYGADKPVCSKCKTHCYKKEMRDRIRIVMRYAGPRMIFHSPILAIFHLIDRLTMIKDKSAG